jgi:LPS O-antigen subunit length determinant protein (WzzB/FepE family)
MLNNKKKKNIEINLFHIFNYILEKKKFIVLFTFLFMSIGYLVGLLTPLKKTTKIIFNSPRVEWLLDYNDFLFYKKKADINFNLPLDRLFVNYIYSNNYILFVFLENLRININSKKILETYLREKNIDDSIEIYCSDALFFCQNITIKHDSISEKQILDLINYFIQITEKSHKLFIKKEFEKNYKYSNVANIDKQNLILIEQDMKKLLSQLKNDDFYKNYINEISVSTFSQPKNKLLIHTFFGFVLGLFLSLFIILLRFGYKNSNLKN